MGRRICRGEGGGGSLWHAVHYRGETREGYYLLNLKEGKGGGGFYRPSTTTICCSRREDADGIINLCGLEGRGKDSDPSLASLKGGGGGGGG